jgi:hypothetical protein
MHLSKMVDSKPFYLAETALQVPRAKSLAESFRGSGSMGSFFCFIKFESIEFNPITLSL